MMIVSLSRCANLSIENKPYIHATRDFPGNDLAALAAPEVRSLEVMPESLDEFLGFRHRGIKK